jgi:hypothetical protein
MGIVSLANLVALAKDIGAEDGTTRDSGHKRSDLSQGLHDSSE